jgi:hypothetical protein
LRERQRLGRAGEEPFHALGPLVEAARRRRCSR